MLYGYDGVSSERVVATVRGIRKSIAWGDDISASEIAGFVEHPNYLDVAVEKIADKAKEAALYPRYWDLDA